MNALGANSDDVEPEERDEHSELARRLREARPFAAPAFIAGLRRAVIDARMSSSESPWRARARAPARSVAEGPVTDISLAEPLPITGN
jgi:hypothetical protein